MTQQEFDRRFETVSKIGMGTLVTGIVLAIVIGLPAAALFDSFVPFAVAIGICIFGGFICVGNFTHDIFCNPRWKR